MVRFPYRKRFARSGRLSKDRPFTDQRYFRGVKQHRLPLLPIGTTVQSAGLLEGKTNACTRSGTNGEPLIVYDGTSFVYSAIKFSDYVKVKAVDHENGYNMQQYCFLQIIDAHDSPSAQSGAVSLT